MRYKVRFSGRESDASGMRFVWNFFPFVPFIRAVADEIEGKILNQEHQVLNQEIICDFENGKDCGNYEETAPDQTVPVLIIAAQNINNQQDVFKHIVQRFRERIHFAVRDNILIEKADQQCGDCQYQCNGFLPEW